MKEPKRGMEAVIAKTSGHGRRKAAMKRKGAPGMAIMIALGKPKSPMMERQEDEREGEDMLDAKKGEGLSKAEKIAALEEKIGYLKAELALLKGESEQDDEKDADEMPDDEEYEDEDEA
jgi:hypothetical protein